MKITFITLTMAIALLTFGCNVRVNTGGGKATSVNSCSASPILGTAAFSYYKWSGGLSILLLHDIDASTSGRLTTNNQGANATMELKKADGTRITFSVDSKDGVTGKVTYLGSSFDPQEGNVFIFTNVDNKLAIQRLNKDMSGLACKIDDVKAFIKQDTDFEKYIKR